MAYPSNFLRLVVIGSLYGAETFTYSLSLAPAGSGGSPPADVPTGVIDAVTAFHTATGTEFGSAARVQAIKLNEIGTNGRYTSQSETVMHEFETSVSGVGVTYLPPQIALAITLRTAARRGRASSGRFFVPRVGGAVANDGRITAASAQSVADAATTFLEALIDAVPGYRPAVMSDIGTGTMNYVTHVEVGRALDTIRSRRTSLSEDRLPGATLSTFEGGGGDF